MLVINSANEICIMPFPGFILTYINIYTHEFYMSSANQKASSIPCRYSARGDDEQG